MEQPKNAKDPATTAPPATKTPKPKPAKQSHKKPATPPAKPKNLPLFNVILLDDDDHTYEYVIEMLAKIFAYPQERGYQLAKEVDATGRVILLTTHKELAELKRDQIHAYGCDPAAFAERWFDVGDDRTGWVTGPRTQQRLGSV